jgi:hypothetical protein
MYRAEYQRQYKIKNKESLQIKRKAYYQANKKRIQEEREANPDKRKTYHLKVTYGITLEDYKQMLANQNECCAICKIPQSELPVDLAVDHCHKTNKIRGLLCAKCNLGLGNFEDSEDSLLQAIKYLRD